MFRSQFFCCLLAARRIIAYSCSRQRQDGPLGAVHHPASEEAAMGDFTLDVNGKQHRIDADPDMPLLYALRNDIGLNNPKFGCGLAQCGACTVHIDGQAVRSCVTPVSDAAGRKIVTLAGLGTPEKPHPLQTAYVEEQVPQCGYCINGWIMTAAAFLAEKKKPSEAEIKQALDGLKCRCGTHVSILKAVKRAATMMG
jgi:aerobic-type carbon monoxide dehydrogenase small subunit (CoxS/CutS family)